MKFEYKGKTYTTTQEPYAANDQEYTAVVIDEAGYAFGAVWKVTDEWKAAREVYADSDYTDCPALLEDESNSCDWDAPFDVYEI